MLERDREHVLAQTGELWNDLRGERIFITGGTGFVGTWLVESFVAANRAHNLGARAVLLTRDPMRFKEKAPHLVDDPAIELHAGDGPAFAPPAGTFAFIIHAATEAHRAPDAEAPLYQFDRDVATTRRVLDLAVTAGTRRLLFTSSGAIYGRQPPQITHVGEEYAGAPDAVDTATAYGQAKRVSEFACATYGSVYPLQAIVARLFAFVGPHLPLDSGYAAGNFIGDVLDGRPIRIAGDGTPLRAYLYAADLAIWLWTLLLRGASGRAYNVGGMEAVSIRELAGRVAEATGTTPEITVAKVPVPDAAPARYVPSSERAQRELGLRQWISLTEGIRRTYEWHLARRRTPDRRP